MAWFLEFFSPIETLLLLRCERPHGSPLWTQG